MAEGSRPLGFVFCSLYSLCVCKLTSSRTCSTGQELCCHRVAALCGEFWGTAGGLFQACWGNSAREFFRGELQGDLRKRGVAAEAGEGAYERAEIASRTGAGAVAGTRFVHEFGCSIDERILLSARAGEFGLATRPGFGAEGGATVRISGASAIEEWTRGPHRGGSSIG